MFRKVQTQNIRMAACGAVALVLALNSISARADSFSSSTQSTLVTIHLQKTDLPASDLIEIQNGKSEMLSPQAAWDLEQNSGVDLSTLDPDPTSDIWKGVNSTADESLDNALPVNAGDTVQFVSLKSATDGRVQFNVQTQARNGISQTITLMAARDVHTYLLRKEILRRLGYKIPPMKYLPKVNVLFPDALTRDEFLNDSLYNGTGTAAPARWIGAAPTSNTVPFQDLVVLQSTPLYYNVALGVPITTSGSGLAPQTMRTLRALAVAYGVTQMGESLNQTGWFAGNTTNGTYDISLPMRANFSCALDDAQWMLRKISQLTRSDLLQAVASSYYPAPIAQLVVEKIIARRDAMNDSFSLNIPAMSFNQNLTVGSAIVNGVVVQQTWPGFASQFAYNAQPSPLAQIWYYVESLVQSNAINALMTEVNAQIPGLTSSSQAGQHAVDLENKAATQYLQTGMVQKIPVGAWAAPLASGSVNVSRNIVFGNYLGTTDLVQLADTIGLSASAGLMVGVDGLPSSLSVQGSVTGSVSISLSHLKPLTSSLTGLQQAMQEPLSNILVTMLTYHASHIFQDMGGAPTGAGASRSAAQLQATLNQDLTELSSVLATGESLILTESLSGSESASLSFMSTVTPTSLAPGATLTGGASEVLLKRIHLFKKNATLVTVYVDGGTMSGLNIGFNLSLGSAVSFPILSIGGSTDQGSASTSVYNVNLNPDPVANPGIYASSLALAALLRDGSTTLLESQQKPLTVSANFSDSTSNFSLFYYGSRSLKGAGQVHVDVPAGFVLTNGVLVPVEATDDYISLQDGSQSGNNYESLASTAATYLLQRETGSTQFGLSAQTSANPGQSFLGSSTTRNTVFQAKLTKSAAGLSLVQPYVRIEHRWEGWKVSTGDVQNLVNTQSANYGFALFNQGFLLDAKSIHLYELSLTTNVYETGIKQVLSLSKKDESKLVRDLEDSLGCNDDDSMGPPASDSNACTGLGDFDSAYQAYQKGISDPTKLGQTMLQAISSLEKALPFSQLTALVGGAQNIFVTGSLSGFRDGSENYSTPIASNTFGNPDPTNPSGILNQTQSLVGIDNGEFSLQWFRSFL